MPKPSIPDMRGSLIIIALAIATMMPAAAAHGAPYEDCSGCDQYAPVLPLPSGGERANEHITREFYKSLAPIAARAEPSPPPASGSQASARIMPPKNPAADSAKVDESATDPTRQYGWLGAIRGAASDDSSGAGTFLPAALVLATLAGLAVVARRHGVKSS